MSVVALVNILFVVSLLVLFYTYAGYPLLVYFVSRISPKRVSAGTHEPPVTIVITAYNEESSIAEKLENTFGIDYPVDKLEILVASDGSTDRTDEIVGEFQERGVRLFRQEGRKGKTYTQNKAVEHANGEIILFSDATSQYAKDVLKKLIPNFSDDSIGCAAGRLIYTDPSGTDVGKGAKRYWSYETFIKQSESNASSLIGASGCMYAVRKSAYRPMYPEACSDFLICTVLYEQGLRSVFAPEALCYEETNRDASHELQMRIRVVSQTFTDLWRNRKMMNPLRSGFYAVQLISHKLLRYAAPVFLAMLFGSSLFLYQEGALFFSALVIQVVFYLLAIAAWILERVNFPIGPLAIPLYLVLTSYASIVGFYKFLRGESYASWETVRNFE